MQEMALLKGLYAGFLATAAMMVVEVPAWMKWGLPGVMEWEENQGIAQKVLRRSREGLTGHGLVLHFIHGGIAGIVFVILIGIFTLGLPILYLGLLYGTLLWLIGLIIYAPIAGKRTSGSRMGRIAVFVNFAGHIVFGFALGILVGL